MDEMMMQEPMPDEMAPEEAKSGIVREKPVVDPAREALVKAWIAKIQNAKKYWNPKFERMRSNQRFASGKQWQDQGDNDDRYISNLVQRHIQQRTAALYAKNPKFVARRKKKLDFAVWDGSMQTAQQAYQALAMVGGDINLLAMMDPATAQLLQDIQQGTQVRKMMDRMGKTAQLLMAHEVSEQIIPFKVSMKQMVRRTLINAVGYVKLGFVREYEMRADDYEKYNATAEQLATLERISSDMLDDAMKSENDAQAAQLKALMETMQQSDNYLVREGLVFDFPASTSIIIDPCMRQIKGFLGANWIAQEFMFTQDQVKELYKIDLKGAGFTQYTRGANGELKQAGNGKGDNAEALAAVYVVYSKSDGQMYVLCEGYYDFLQEPAEPEVKLERFWPIFALSFNDMENEEDPLPPSDVDLLRPLQMEYNRAREGLREHRFANRPATGVAAGQLSEEDKGKLQSRPANAVLELNGLQPGQSVDALLQPIKHAPIDPAVYDTNYVFDDMQRTVGGSEAANFGGTSGGTATEVAVSESSRATSNGSHVDDLDDLLNELARAAGQVLLTEVSQEKAMEVAGPGAVWPSLSTGEAAKELLLEIQAGSSGKPNKALEIQNFTQMQPVLAMIPGINPEWMAKQAIERIDDHIDLEDAFIAGMPSITAQNAIASAPPQMPTGDPDTDPAQQGGEGANNASKQPEAAVQTGAKQPRPEDFMPVTAGM